MPIITATNIHKTFGKGTLAIHVLRGISLSVDRGEFVAIMGRSGAGKSTLLYQLSALDRPSDGAVVIDNLPVHTLATSELSRFRLNTLGYVFQDYALIPDLTALENVQLPLLMRGIDWTRSVEMAMGALSAVNLPGRFGNLPAELSGGEQQRVAIARAIAGKPKILFADEPTANLDSISGKTVVELLASLNREGQTIVMVTHELEYTRTCHRILTVEDGLIVREESGAANEPAPEYVNPVYTALEKASGQRSNII